MARDLFDRLSVNQKGLVLCKQKILYRLEEAKRMEDKYEDVFYSRIYKIIESYWESLGSLSEKSL